MLEGCNDGELDGEELGWAEGLPDGDALGLSEGTLEGEDDGWLLGVDVGCAEGEPETEGLMEGKPVGAKETEGLKVQ